MIPNFIKSNFMIKLMLILAFLLLFISGNSSAQTETSNFLGGSFGGSDFHIKDEHASPLIYSSIGIAPAIEYLHNSPKSRHHFEGFYFYNYLGTAADNYHTDNHRAKIRYSYLHSITDLSIIDKEIKFFLGGSASTFLSHSEYYYNWTSGTLSRSMESWYWSNSLDLSAQLEVNFAEREFFSLQLFIPILSNVSRPKYSPTADYDYVHNDWKFKMFGETELFTKNFFLNTLISYQHPLLWNFNFQISYEFYYSIYKKPQDVNLYMNNLRAGLFFCF